MRCQKELNSYLYEYAYGKVGLVILHLKLQNLWMMLSEDLLYICSVLKMIDMIII